MAIVSTLLPTLIKRVFYLRRPLSPTSYPHLTLTNFKLEEEEPSCRSNIQDTCKAVHVMVRKVVYAVLPVLL